MSSEQDFIIEHDVLKAYKGPGGDVVIPDRVTEIGVRAFKGCIGLTSVSIPASVRKIGWHAFYGCTSLSGIWILGKPEILKGAFPDVGTTVIAEQLTLSAFPAPRDKQAAVKGFARRYTDGAELTEAYRADCLKYIKGQRKKLYPIAMDFVPLLHVMLAESMVPKGEIPALIDQAAAGGRAEVTAMLLDYQEQQLRPEERQKAQAQKIQREMDFMLTGVLTAAEAKKNWRYEKDASGQLCILGCKGQDTEAAVPAFIGKAPVTAIGDYAFSPNASPLPEAQREQRRQITAVHLPKGIVHIGRCAFDGCTALTEISIPDGITSIGGCAFAGCTGLLDVALPDTLLKVDGGTFLGCKNLKSIRLPSSVTKIG